MEDLRKASRDRIQCPYYTAREAIKEADIIVFNYLYLLDPQISSNMLKLFAKSNDSIVVFDEAHNIDDVCLEAYTLKLNNQLVGAATGNIRQLEERVEQIGAKNRETFRNEFAKVAYSFREKLGKELEEGEREEIISNYIP
jgi:DNA excision repair protein ERCC-2